MANSFAYFTGDGITTNFNFGFGYIDESYVKVYVDSNLLPDGSYTYTISNSIATISPAPAGGLEVYIKRVTPTASLVDFVEGSVLTETDLDLIALQALHVAVEAGDAAAVGLQLDATETFWDADSKTIGNLPAASSNGQAVRYDEYSVTQTKAVANETALTTLNNDDASGGALLRDATAWDANSLTIQNLSAAVNSTDAVTKGYVDSEMLHKNSGTNYDAQNLKVVNLATPTADSDASTKEYVDDMAAQHAIWGTAVPVPVNYTGDGIETDYTVTNVTHGLEYALLVAIDGVVQQAGVNYTLAEPGVGETYSTLTFTGAPPNGSKIAITNFGVIRAFTDYSIVADGTSKLRTMGLRLKEQSYNVKDYGAEGDGATNDTTAIQNALNAAQTTGGIVHFPAGTYLVTSPLTVYGNTVVQGVGAESVIKNTNSTITFNCNGVSGVRFSNFKGTWSGGTNSTAGRGFIHFQSTCSNCMVDHVWIDTVTTCGISITGTPTNFLVDSVYVNATGEHGIYVTAADKVVIVNSVLTNISASAGVGSGDAIRVDGSSNVTVSNCVGYTGGSNGLHLSGATSNANISNCVFNSSTGNGVYVDTSGSDIALTGITATSVASSYGLRIADGDEVRVLGGSYNAASGLYAVRVDTAADDVYFVSPYLSAGYGFDIDNGYKTHIVNPFFDVTNDKYSAITDVTVSVKDFGAKGDGTTDDTTAVKAALNSPFENIYFPHGTYNVSSWGTTPVTISSSKRLFGDGTANITFDNDALFKPTSGTFVLEGLNFAASSTGIVIYDTATTGQLDLLRVRKCKFYGTTRYSIWTRCKFDKAEVIDCEFDGVDGMPIQLGYGGSGSDNYYKSVVIRGNIFKDMSDALAAGRIALIYSKDVLIEGNRVENYTYTHSTGNIELFYTKSIGAKIVNNTIDGITATTTGTCAVIVLKGVARGGTLSSATDQYGYQNIVKGNIIRNITSGGTITGIDNHVEEVIIDSNIVEIPEGGTNCYCIDTNTTSELVISNNRLLGGNKGIDGQNLEGNVTVSNNIVENANSVGIDIRISSATKTATVSNNQINYSSGTAATPQGIIISGAGTTCTGNSIILGSAAGAGSYGINILSGNASNNYVETGSGVVGIRVASTSGCNVIGNTVTQTISQVGTLTDILDNNIHNNIVAGAIDRPAGVLAMGSFIGDNPASGLEQDINVASVTRTAAGEFDILFTTALPSANYIVLAQHEGSTRDFIIVYDRLTTGFTVKRANHAGTDNDRSTRIFFQVVGVN